MRNISDTLARLAAMRAQKNTPGLRIASTDPLSTLGDFGSNPGALQARFYLPEVLPRGAPLVVVLHGCTQNAAGYDYGSGWSQLADQMGFALVFPEQQRSNNPNLCFNWFLPKDTTRDHGEALSIREMIEAMIVAHGLDRKRVFITGLSAGGAMAAAMLAIYPEVFAGGGIIAGLPYGSATTVPEAFDRMRGHGGPSPQDLQTLMLRASKHKGQWPRISIWQGSADNTVAPSNAQAIAAQWRGVHKLDTPPTHTKSVRGWTTQVWCDATGEANVEVNMIAGMGHGTPLGSDGLGNAGPYMLDVGISSTREIARFWGIAETSGEVTDPLSTANGTAGAQSSNRQHEPGKERARVEHTRDSALTLPPSGRDSSTPGVKQIIEDALRAAGLMR